MSPNKFAAIDRAEDAGAEEKRKSKSEDESTPPIWFWKVIAALLGVTGIPAAIAILTVWSKLAVIESRIDGLSQALQASASLQADSASLRAQQAALAERLQRIEARLDRQAGAP